MLLTTSACSMAFADTGTVTVTSRGEKRRVVHIQPSSFSPVVVYETARTRCLTFGHVDNPDSDTCIDADGGKYLTFEYVRVMVAGVLMHPRPANILVIGLGGGTLPTTLAALSPAAQIDSVDIDPAVLEVAIRYFGYTPGPRQRPHIADGRAFIEEAVRHGRRYDLVFLDAFGAGYIPAHMMTVEFLEQVRAVLSESGVVIANTAASSEWSAAEHATYQQVFGRVASVTTREGDAGNRVLFASRSALPDIAELKTRAQQYQHAVAPYGVDMGTVISAFEDDAPFALSALPLHD